MNWFEQGRHRSYPCGNPGHPDAHFIRDKKVTKQGEVYARIFLSKARENLAFSLKQIIPLYLRQ
jgi:hypothetical protein